MIDRQEVHISYHRPPDATERFVQRLVRDDSHVKVTFSQNVHRSEPLLIGGQVALEAGADVVWFTFPGEWHDVGRFHRADGTWTGVYANILTPCAFEEGDIWRTTDLFLDLWIPASDRPVAGRPLRPRVLDTEELEHAEASGWVSAEWADKARAEAQRLVAAAQAGTWPPASVWEWTRAKVLPLVSGPEPGDVLADDLC